MRDEEYNGPGGYWEGKEGIPQDDGPEPVVQILYSERFKLVMGYFRRALKENDLSEQTLAMTEDVIELNSANYTAWHFRKLCLLHLGSDFSAEMEFISRMAEESPKNYQLWQHRRWCLSQSPNDPEKELEHTAMILEQDSKNYHAWAHRQWAIREFNLTENELSFTKKLLEKDPRNNSAWNQRFFIHKLAGDEFDLNSALAELDYTFEVIALTPHNQSPWNYVSGILNHFKYPTQLVGVVSENCENVFSQYPSCHYALTILFETYEKYESFKDLEWAINSCQTMAKLDPTRKRYWEWKLTGLSRNK